MHMFDSRSLKEQPGWENDQSVRILSDVGDAITGLYFHGDFVVSATPCISPGSHSWDIVQFSHSK